MPFSRWHDLPTEIRLQVWEHALPDPSPEAVLLPDPNQQDHQPSPSSLSPIAYTAYPAIAHTSFEPRQHLQRTAFSHHTSTTAGAGSLALVPARPYLPTLDTLVLHKGWQPANAQQQQVPTEAKHLALPLWCAEDLAFVSAQTRTHGGLPGPLRISQSVPTLAQLLGRCEQLASLAVLLPSAAEEDSTLLPGRYCLREAVGEAGEAAMAGAVLGKEGGGGEGFLLRMPLEAVLGDLSLELEEAAKAIGRSAVPVVKKVVLSRYRRGVEGT